MSAKREGDYQVPADDWYSKDPLSQSEAIAAAAEKQRYLAALDKVHELRPGLERGELSVEQETSMLEAMKYVYAHRSKKTFTKMAEAFRKTGKSEEEIGTLENHVNYMENAAELTFWKYNGRAKTEQENKRISELLEIVGGFDYLEEDFDISEKSGEH